MALNAISFLVLYNVKPSMRVLDLDYILELWGEVI